MAERRENGDAMDVFTTRTILTLALQAGNLLLVNGAETEQVETSMERVASAYGLPSCQANVTLTSLAVSLNHSDLAYPITIMQRVRRRTLNYTMVAAIFSLIGRLEDGKLNLAAAQAEIEALATHPRSYPHWLRPLAWAGTSAASAVLLGAQPLEATLAFLIVLPAVYLKQFLEMPEVPALFADLPVAALITAVTLIVAHTGVPIRTTVVIAGSLFMLLPGSAIVASAQDIIAGNLLSSAARGMEGFLTGAAVAAGVGLALDLTLRQGASTLSATTAMPGGPLLWQLVAALFASMCFGVACQIPRFTIIAAGLIGSCGWLTYLLVIQLSGSKSPFIATFLAALAVGIASRIAARLQRTSASLYTLPGILPLLPGLTIYQGMLAIATGQTVTGLILLVLALVIGGVIAAGTAFSSLPVAVFHRVFAHDTAAH